MYSLILVIFSIVLLATLTLAAINYAPVGVTVTERIASGTVSALEELDEGWNAYRLQNQTMSWTCETYTGSTGEEFEECEREINDPGYLPQGNWEDDLSPEYVFLPPAPGEGTWSYSNPDDSNVYFCLSADYGEYERKGLERASQRFSDQSFVVSDSCGASSDMVFNEGYEGTVALTYWLRQS